MARLQSGHLGHFLNGPIKKWPKLLNYLHISWPKGPKQAIQAISKMARSGNGLKLYIITKWFTYFNRIKIKFTSHLHRYKIMGSWPERPDWDLEWAIQKWPDLEMA